MSFAELAAAVDGSVITDGPQLEAHAWDFSGALHRRPRAVVRAAGERDARLTFAYAREQATPVTIRSGGYSGHGQALGEGIVLTPAVADRPAKLLPDGSAEVDPAASWQSVEQALAAHGRAVPVLPAFLSTTVGGTLSVGGYGTRSIARGNQLDHVESVRVLRPDGSRLRCSRTEEADLFGLALGTLGQLGLVDRVVIRTVPRRPTNVFRRSFANFTQLAAWLADPPQVDALFSFNGRREVLSGSLGVHLGIDAGGPLPPPAGAVPVAEGQYLSDALDQDVRRWLIPHGSDVRLFTDVIVDHGGLMDLARWLDSGAARARSLDGVYVLASRNGDRFPFDGRHGDDDLVYGLGLYAFSPRGDDFSRRAAEALLRDLVHRCLAAGGRPFLSGWQRLSEADLAGLYGEAYDRLRVAREEADPAGLLNRGSLNGPP